MERDNTNTLAVMETLYSQKYGLAARLDLMASAYKNLKVSTKEHNYVAGNTLPAFLTLVTKADTKEEVAGSGLSLNPEISKIKAFGEFIERDSCMYSRNNFTGNMLFGSYDDLKNKGLNCIDLKDFIYFENQFYKDPQFNFKKYHSHSSTAWIEGRDLTNNTSVWLPAQKIFTTYPLQKDEPRFIFGISTGAACGSSFCESAQSAICEVIERDSFMLTWLLRAPGIRIDIDSIQNEELKILYNHICSYLTGEDRLFIYDISKTFGVYTIFTYIRNDLPGAYGLIVSASSHTNPEVALHKALEEVCQGYIYAYHSLLNDEKKKCQHLGKEDIDSLEKHFLYYSTGRHSHNIDFISATEEYVCLSELKDYSKNTTDDNLQYLISLFRERKHSIFIADVTKPEYSSIGFYVLKVIIPDYLDLNPLQHRFRQKSGKRLREYQKQYGVEINDDPHPFP